MASRSATPSCAPGSTRARRMLGHIRAGALAIEGQQVIVEVGPAAAVPGDVRGVQERPGRKRSCSFDQTARVQRRARAAARTPSPTARRAPAQHLCCKWPTRLSRPSPARVQARRSVVSCVGQGSQARHPRRCTSCGCQTTMPRRDPSSRCSVLRPRRHGPRCHGPHELPACLRLTQEQH
jgi:hypothetical protein